MTSNGNQNARMLRMVRSKSLMKTKTAGAHMETYLQMVTIWKLTQIVLTHILMLLFFSQNTHLHSIQAHKKERSLQAGRHS